MIMLIIKMIVLIFWYEILNARFFWTSFCVYNFYIEKIRM